MKKFEKITNFQCENFVFDSNFDSGNLGRVELVRRPLELIDKTNLIPSTTSATPPSTSSSSESANATIAISSPPSSSKEKRFDFEFNLWTRPDCYGTPFENSNRTWFYFSILGGEKNQLIKFNVMNLNKQAKLFSQGMHPVVKHGSNGKWERVKDKPLFNVTDENFIMSFFHRTHENAEDILTFYAFTFPYTYTEQMTALDGYGHKFEKSSEEVDIIIREMNVPRKDKIIININEDINQDFSIVDDCSVSENKEILDVMTEDATDGIPFRDFVKAKEAFKTRSKSSTSNVIDENTSESMQQLSSLVNNVKIEKASPETILAYMAQDIRSRLDEVKDDIYYYRELLINSYEGKRVDLITITSIQGIEDKREERLKNLFPDHSKPRCHTFKEKKIIFLSSRVHPGETPSSFVLNGFLNLLLDRKNQAGILLRKMYVFKVVPFLNPDGVYNGCYRSDTLGHNLNRVYLNPRLDTQPSIYAVRKLIRFYHFGYDKPDDFNEIGELIVNNDVIVDESIDYKPASIFDEPPADVPDENKPEQNVQSPPEFLIEQPLAETPIEPDEQIHQHDEDIDMDDHSLEMPEMKIKITPAANQDDNKLTQRRCVTQPGKPLKKMESIDKGSSKSRASTSFNKLRDTAKNVKILVSNEKKASSKSDGSAKNKLSASLNRPQHHHYKHFISHYNNEKQQKLMQQQYFSQQPHQGLNISMDFRMQIDENGDKSVVEENTNLFLYLDLHGHASKKGVFMYGNHLANTLEAVEVMLLPRLMSMNCHHFHFDACNFSERNMYLKGKRDGLSKEGSGRVAIYKSTGLIKCYTLESNYNTTKCVNILPPKGKEVSCKVHNLIPPKFTPAIFEEVGRALGPSLLDLTNSNPCSRLMNSEFRTLQGLRNSLKNEISRGASKARVSKFAKANTKKRQTTITLPSAQDVSKENKIYNHPTPSSSSNSSSSHSNSLSLQLLKSQPGSQTSKVLGSKMKSSGKIQAFGKKDVNALPAAKKKKVLEVVNATTGSVMSAQVPPVNQIPRKKIKVSNSVSGPATFIHQVKGDATTSVTTPAPPLENQLTDFLLNSDSLDDEMVPCCSTTKTISSIIYQKSSPSSPSGSSTSSNVSGQIKITSFMSIKKSKKLKFGKPTSKIGKKLKKLTPMTSTEDCPSTSQNVTSLSLDSTSQAATGSSSKLIVKKKKRTLSDASLKRKKLRAKPLLH